MDWLIHELYWLVEGLLSLNYSVYRTMTVFIASHVIGHDNTILTYLYAQCKGLTDNESRAEVSRVAVLNKIIYQ